jgi:hypothetical protein
MTSLLVKNILEVTEEIIYDIILICTEWKKSGFDTLDTQRKRQKIDCYGEF